MRGKLSIAAADAAILIAPTTLSALLTPGAAVRGDVVRGIPTPADLERSSRSAGGTGSQDDTISQAGVVALK